MPFAHRTAGILRPVIFALGIFTVMAVDSPSAGASVTILSAKRLFSTDSIGDTPSIFFVIDNSGSMALGNYGVNPNDQWGNRFKVPSAFTDTILKYYPSAQIGFAVFHSYLYFRPNDDPLFAQLPAPFDTCGGYIPLFALNKTYGDKLGYQIIKQFLAIDTATATFSGRTYEYADLVYKPSVPWPVASTNITIGFEAAKHAMLSSAHPPKNQFVIFLSDGDANEPLGNPWVFVAGTNVPTTFTIFFTPNALVPLKIDTMTMNIRNNGYSASNPKSNLWPYQNTTADSLMSFLMKNIFPEIAPSAVDINIQTFPADTIGAGDTVILWGSCLDRSGKRLPAQSDSIRWSLDSSNVQAGDRILSQQNDSTRFTATVAFRTVGIIGSFHDRDNLIIDTAWIFVKPAAAFQVDIELENSTALSAAQVIAAARPTIPQPRLSVYFDSSQVLMYAYTVLRDRFGNICQLADHTEWKSLDTDTATVTGTANKLFEGQIVHTAGARQGSTFIITSSAQCVPDTAQVVIRPDKLLALRLVNSTQPMLALDTIKMTTAESMDIKVQAQWSTAPNIWVNASGLWSIDPDTFKMAIPVPVVETGLWTCRAISIGEAMLTVSSGSVRAAVPMIIAGAGVPPKLTLTLLNDPDSCFVGLPIKLLAFFETSTGPLPGSWCCSAVLHDAADNSGADSLPWMLISGNTQNSGKKKDSLDKTTTECFLNGVDTISLFLYAVSGSQDILHQLQLTLNNQYSGKTIAFGLKNPPIGVISSQRTAEQEQVRFVMRKNSVSIRLPRSGKHLLSVYSISGRLLDRRSACGGDVVFRLPKGGYILSVASAGAYTKIRKFFIF